MRILIVGHRVSDRFSSTDTDVSRVRLTGPDYITSADAPGGMRARPLFELNSNVRFSFSYWHPPSRLLDLLSARW